MTALSQHKIKIIRLQNGEDIISDCITNEQEKLVQLNNPMALIVKRTIKGTVMMLIPWLPLEVISDNIAIITFHNVLTFVDPKEDLIEYYNNMVEQAKMSIAKNDDVLKVLKEELLVHRDETLDQLLPEEKEMIIMNLENSTNERKKKLH
jgi:uncharacterized coiled-coil protein SlyX